MGSVWCDCSITYKFNTEDESFEWYDLRNRNQNECKVLKGKIDVLAQSEQPPAAKSAVQNGYRTMHKQGRPTCFPQAF